MDILRMIEQIKRQQPIEQRQVKKLCQKVQQILVDESNMQPISSPVNVIGDVHGQFYDVLKIFELSNLLFISKVGLYPIRNTSLLVILQIEDITLFKLFYFYFVLNYSIPIEFICQGAITNPDKFPACMVFTKKSPENMETLMYGNIVTNFLTTYHLLPLLMVNYLGVLDQIFCVHGGLSPDIHALDQISEFNRKMEIPTEGPFADLVWSDPEQIETWAHGSRGAGWLFGHRVVNEFNRHNGLKLIARAHQLAQQGYVVWFQNKNLVTVWSAPNYCYRCNNMASIMKVNEQLEHSFLVFGPDEKSKQSTHYSKIIPYFL